MGLPPRPQLKDSKLARTLRAMLGSVLVASFVTTSVAEELFDSGWAVAPSPATELQDSPLGAKRVPIDQLVPGGDLDRIVVPPRAIRKKASSGKPAPAWPQAKAPNRSGLKWRPRRPQQPTPAEAPPGEVRPGEGQPQPLAKPLAKAPADGTQLPGIDDLPEETPVAEDQPDESLATTPKPAPKSPPAEDHDELREPAPFPGFDDSAAAKLADSAEPAPDQSGPKKSRSEESRPEESDASGTPRLAKRPSPRKPVAKPSLPGVQPESSGKPQAGTRPKGKAPAATDPTGEQPADETPIRDDDAGADVAPADGPRIQRAPILKNPVPEPTKPLTRNQQYLRRRLRSVLSYYYRRPLNSRDHDPWELMHGMLAYGLHSRVLDTTSRNKPVTAIGYLCFNKPCKRKRLMHLTPDGQLDADVAYGLQGHRGQFLAMLAQCDVSPDYPLKVGGKEMTIVDLILAEQRTCYADSELTFKLIGLMHYLDSSATWVNEDGEPWDMPRLINEERNQRIRGAACGGTHRLSGLTLAAKLRVARGEPLDGEYLEAQRFVEKYQNLAFRLQNQDGSLSTEWFRGPGAEEDINRRVRTTGHLLEWLIYALPDEKLTDYRTVRAVNYLTSLLASNTDNLWEIGPLSHALHALVLYDQRVFRPHDSPTQVVRQRNGQTTTRPTPEPNYRQIASRVYSTYPPAEEIKAALEEPDSRGGLRGLFGIGGKPSSRRSR